MPRTFQFYDRVRRPELNYPEMTGEWTEYEIKQVKKSTGPGEDDFEIEEVVIEHKTNIDEFIQSYKNEAGVEAVLRKVALGDLSQVGQGLHADLSGIPEDPGEAFALANKVEEAFAKLDPELTQGLNIEDFISGLNEEKLDAYLEKKVAEKLAAKKGSEE